MKILKFLWDNAKGEEYNGKSLILGQHLPKRQDVDVTHLEIYGICLDIADSIKFHRNKFLRNFFMKIKAFRIYLQWANYYALYPVSRSVRDYLLLSNSLLRACLLMVSHACPMVTVNILRQDHTSRFLSTTPYITSKNFFIPQIYELILILLHLFIFICSMFKIPYESVDCVTEQL